MVALKGGECLNGRLLKHLFQDGRRTTAADEHPVILGDGSIQPQTVADDISIRDGLQGLRGTDEYITTHYHRMDAVRSHLHHLFIQWQLHTQEILCEALSPLPPEYWQGHQHLPRYSITGQSLALSTGMDEDAFLLAKPRIELRIEN